MKTPPTDICSNYWKSQFKTALQNLPNIVCSGRFATHRLRAFFARKHGSVSWVGSRGNPPLKLAVVRTEGGCVSLPVPFVSAGWHPSARGKDHAA
jgi:hypothetical protein